MTYPLCIACDAHILDDANRRNLDDGRATHAQCPDVEDLESLPLVERAAIACSMQACDAEEHPVLSWDAYAVCGHDVSRLETRAYSRARRLLETAIRIKCAEAEALIRTGEVTP